VRRRFAPDRGELVLSQVSFIAASCGGLETCSKHPALKKSCLSVSPSGSFAATSPDPFQKTLKLRAEIAKII